MASSYEGSSIPWALCWPLRSARRRLRALRAVAKVAAAAAAAFEVGRTIECTCEIEERDPTLLETHGHGLTDLRLSGHLAIESTMWVRAWARSSRVRLRCQGSLRLSARQKWSRVDRSTESEPKPFRAVAARLISRIAAAIGRGGIGELSRTGLIVVEDFLPVDEFELLRDETAFSQTRPPSRVITDGGTRTDIWTLPPSDGDRFQELERVVSAAEQHLVLPTHGLRTLEHLHIDNPDEHDGQTDLHIDAPFDTHKLWLYLDEVTPDRAPFVDVPDPTSSTGLASRVSTSSRSVRTAVLGRSALRRSTVEASRHAR